MTSLTLSSAPAAQPVSDAVVWSHLNVALSGSPEAPANETLIAAYRNAAVAHLDGASGILGRALITQTWELRLCDFPRCPDPIHGDYRIIIPLPPLQSISSIAYVDPDGATQTLVSSKYTTVAGGSQKAAVVPAYGESWPSTRDVPDAVTVTFVAGYGGTESDVPASIKSAILLMVGDLYDHREAQSVGYEIHRNPAVEALLAPYEVR